MGTRNSWGGHRVGTLPPTFGDYVMDHADRFEYGDTFGTLERAFLRGTLPHHYPTLGALVDKLIADSVDGVDLGQVADLWAAFEGWRTQVTATT